MEQVPLDFHARYSCKGKEYVYQIWNHPVRDPFLKDRALHYWYPIDEALLDAGDQLDNMSSGWGEERLEELTAKKDHYAMPFMESIHMIDKLYNSPMELCFDRENLYLLGAE